MGSYLLWAVIWALSVISQPCGAGELGWYGWRGIKEIPFGGSVDEMRAIKIHEGVPGKDRRIIIGDRVGQVHVLRFKDGKFSEDWTGDPLRSSIAEVFVEDINADGKLEIVAYSEIGDITFYDMDTYDVIWRSADREFEAIFGFTIANVDDDPQLELVISGLTERSPIGKLVVYDCRHLFMEWVAYTQADLTARSIVVADLDNDEVLEIALNSGYVIDCNLRQVEWEHTEGFGDVIGFFDADGDEIPELVAQGSDKNNARLLRFFDVDLRRENLMLGALKAE